MPTIDIIIRNKTASAVNPPCIVCGNSDYNVKFDFDDEWQAHTNKIGVFAYNRCGEWQSEKVLFEGDTCPVPALHGVRRGLSIYNWDWREKRFCSNNLRRNRNA